MSSPFLDKPRRSYTDAALDNAEQMARQMNAAKDVWITVSEFKARLSDQMIPATEFYETLDESAIDAAETPGYRYTIQIKDGVPRILWLKRIGEGVLAEQEEDEARERQHRHGLVSYGRP